MRIMLLLLLPLLTQAQEIGVYQIHNDTVIFYGARPWVESSDEIVSYQWDLYQHGERINYYQEDQCAGLAILLPPGEYEIVRTSIIYDGFTTRTESSNEVRFIVCEQLE